MRRWFFWSTMTEKKSRKPSLTRPEEGRRWRLRRTECRNGHCSHLRPSGNVRSSARLQHARKVFVDDKQLFDKDLIDTWPNGALEINAGLFANYGRGGAWTVRFDNIVLDAK